MPKSLQNYLYIGQSQRKGIIIALVLLILYGLFRHIYIQNNSDIFNASFPVEKNTTPFNKPVEKASTHVDINQITHDDLIASGFPEKLAKRIIHYRDKIGGFNRWDQVKKVYGLTQNQLHLIQSQYTLSHNKENKAFASHHNFAKRQTTHVKSRFNLSPFDPNTITYKELQMMGLPKNIINGLINFRKSGFVYKKPEDLRKLYAMDEKTYVKIQPFLIFSQVDHSLKTKYKQPNKVFQSIDINTATEVQLIELPGIGKYYARIILNWRNKLGGFSNIDQIKSTYNLPDSIFNKITDYIRFSTPPTQINVNTSDAHTLAKHFYIKAKEAQIIVNYRNNHGPYAQVDDLIKTGALTKEWITKVGPYLKVSD